ncbi:Histidine kinase-, DNA gyrase B-, and HSP90-like ATPase [Roseomonas rosea]|uniref:Histidine kinase-, DNA gyrase B-, and HSP90-like ATPase n=1 Tax=Muricoccus roseus TaxID=198092 RepID=A0A1M6FGA3_9PROT|nr:ATP-binding protein [Roseomonas rosea]SHI96695.1 Histidine kinase-, DNA gyrase B-, and HSP90-like ATPase [Roseomonas rosea]
MTILKLAAKQDHLEKIARVRDPVKAVAEFIWNALDGDATEVLVEFDVNELGGTLAVIVRDNGTGFSQQEAEREFQGLGNSWKLQTNRTPKYNRVVHGKEGKGRLRFFSLAHKAKWESVWELKGDFKKTTVLMDSKTLEECDVTEESTDAKATGTKVFLSQLKEPFDYLTTNAAHAEITAIFAPYLLEYDAVRVLYNGKLVDPKSAITFQRSFPVRLIHAPGRIIDDLKLSVIEWNAAAEPLANRRIQLGLEAGVVLGSQPAGITAPDFLFTVYAYSSFFKEVFEGNLLEIDDLTDPDFRYVLEEIRDVVGRHFRERKQELTSELIDQLRKDGAYPYEGDPGSEVEKRERQVFDMATQALSSYSRHFRKAETQLKRMTLVLLKEALRHNPESLSHILQAVVNLPKNKQDDFSDLLTKTDLGSVIAASSFVAERVRTLTLLRKLVFDPKHKAITRERGELDMLVRDNTWIFGENFNVSVPEVGLTRVVERVAQEVNAKSSKRSVRKMDGSIGRLDCLLGRTLPTGREDQFEFLIVELKRPSISIGTKEIDQIMEYCHVLTSQSEFAGLSINWTFFLVTGEMNALAKMRAHQRDRPAGLLHEGENEKIWVKTWAEVIQPCEARLKFVQDRLQIRVSQEDLDRTISATRDKLFRAKIGPNSSGGESEQGQ